MAWLLLSVSKHAGTCGLCKCELENILGWSSDLRPQLLECNLLASRSPKLADVNLELDPLLHARGISLAGNGSDILLGPQLPEAPLCFLHVVTMQLCLNKLLNGLLCSEG